MSDLDAAMRLSKRLFQKRLGAETKDPRFFLGQEKEWAERTLTRR
jgi:hypothetical protein